MKKSILLISASLITLGTFAQGKSQEHKKAKSNNGHAAKATKANDVIVYGNDNDEIENHGNGKGKDKIKYSKNIPTKVAAAFQRDYPGAVNPVWTKSRGNWTVTFGNGIYRSTATYHANGDRRDTQTPVLARQAPRTIWDAIFKRYPSSTPERKLMMLERPGQPTVYRFRDIVSGVMQTITVDENGNFTY